MEQMCMIGVAIVYPDGFKQVDIIVPKSKFDAAIAVVQRIHGMLEKNTFYADVFDPKTDYIKCLEVEGIDSCVLRYITQDDEVEFPRGGEWMEFFVDLDK